jgi:hypothetical protein
LYQKDFEHGALFITKPGKYVLMEDIVFHYFDKNQKQLTNDGFINPTFNGNGGSARANIGIAICCDNVTIDGNGYSMQQSAESSTLNRVFTVIECSGFNLTKLDGEPRKCPVIDADTDPEYQDASQYYGNNNKSFGNGGGPQEANPDAIEEFYDDIDKAGDKLLEQYQKQVGQFADIGSENVVIKNLTMGRSSHFGLHGTDNRGLQILDCKFIEFEVAAIWLNNPIQPKMKRLDIVGMQEYPQTLSQLSAFRTQGTGVKGVVNASYWGIILNMAFGGVGQVFPQPTGGTLPHYESGKSFGKQQVDNKVDGLMTDGGINRQNIGGRNATFEDINIAQLQSQMITGVTLARQDALGDYVPLLFSNVTDPESGIGGGGHGGYTAKDSTILEAIKDGCAFYHNDICRDFYESKKDDAEWQKSVVDRLNSKDIRSLYPSTKDLTPGPKENTVKGFRAAIMKYLRNYDEASAAGKPQENKLRLADRALQWVDKDSEGKPKYNPYHQGLVQYRGKDVHDYDKFIYTFTNVYKGVGSSRAVNRPYETMLAGKSDSAVYCFSANATDGKPWCRSSEDSENPIWRASVIMPIVNDMIRNHSGNNKGEPWWVSRNLGHQNTAGMPVDFGGHEMNGVVSIHCDRIWGCTFDRVNVVNARNLKDPNYGKNVVNYQLNDRWPLLDGFAASVWGFMMNDSGGNIVRDCTTLNMLARTGASFAMHNAFGSRGNLWENCRVLSSAGGAMWGFVADKGAAGNIFRGCLVQNLVGSSAAAGFVLRGEGNLVEDSKAMDIQVVLDVDLFDTDDEGVLVGSTIPAIASERVVAGFLCDMGGADEPEFVTRRNGHNIMRRCEVIKVTNQTSFHLDRHAYMLHMNQKGEGQLLKDNQQKVKQFLTGSDPSKFAEVLDGLTDKFKKSVLKDDDDGSKVQMFKDNFEAVTGDDKKYRVAAFISDQPGNVLDTCVAYHVNDLTTSEKQSLCIGPIIGTISSYY